MKNALQGESVFQLQHFELLIYFTNISLSSGERRPFALVAQSVIGFAGDDMDVQVGHGLPGGFTICTHEIDALKATAVHQKLGASFHSMDHVRKRI